ncbi:MAG: MBL fold metallo-hydrolase [Spirochaetales bacterium]|nr:MBL fold metallo-hydrolase [Spirochaetales bacterium]
MSNDPYEHDVFDVNGSPLRLTALGHSTLMWEWKGQVLHLDPWTAKADYTKLPRADFILVTHEHPDHLDKNAIQMLKKTQTRLLVNPAVRAILGEGEALANHDRLDLGTFQVEAVPAYNITPGREMFHPKGRDNGYLLTFDGLRVLIAGDTEDHEELRSLRSVDIAFLPMNQPYTMTPEQVASAARALRPKILFPYHFGETDPQKLVLLLEKEKSIEVRVRRLA